MTVDVLCRSILRVLLSDLTACCAIWCHLCLTTHNNIIIVHISQKTRYEVTELRMEVSDRKRMKLGASAMAISHAGLHHHSSWMDSSARWAKSCLLRPVLLSTCSLSLLDDCLVTDGLPWPFPLRHSSEECKHHAK